MAIVVAFGLVAAGLVVAVPRLTGGPSYPKAWDPRVAPIAAFVQAHRGLRWKHPVKVEFLPPRRFDALMAKETAPDKKASTDGKTAFAMMRAMGVASGNVDLTKAEQQFSEADVVGQYVDSDQMVYVQGDDLTPYVRSVLAHELTHALQAEYFDLEKIREGHADDDQAVTALVEGDAVRVQDAYVQSLSPADQQRYAEEAQQMADQADHQSSAEAIPQFLVDEAQFPYDFGPTFVAALVAKGGNAEVDAAFRHPPTLDSEILDPETYSPGAGAPSVALPALPAGARRLEAPSGFGEVNLVELLGDQVGFARAWPVAQGWMQGQVVPYRDHARVCVAVAVLTDTPGSAANLVETGRAWAAHLPSASVSRSGTTVGLWSCDPGARWKPAGGVPDPYQALAARSVALFQLITDGHLGMTRATCAADQLLGALGPQALQEAEQSTDPGSPAVQALRTALIQALAGCS